jgi:23S rRNA pseudouridine2605 synthase
VTSTASDPSGKVDLSGFLAQMPEGVFQVGRLDRLTTGLLLFTSDGDLASAITRPEHTTDKVYWLWLNEAIGDDDPRLSTLVDGVFVCGRRMRAHRVELSSGTPDYAELLVTLREGRNRQIRRMCRALDLRLLHLHRRSVGPVDLQGLPVGAWRTLASSEVDGLWASTGGRERSVARKIAALGRAAAAARDAGEPMARLEAWLGAHRHPEP